MSYLSDILGKIRPYLEKFGENLKKRPFLWIFIVLAAFVSSVFYSGFRSLENQPWYGYSRFVWTDDSRELLFQRKPIFPSGVSGEEATSLCTVDINGRHTEVAMFDGFDRLEELGFSRDGSEFYYGLSGPGTLTLYGADLSGRKGLQEAVLPFSAYGKVFYSRDLLVFSRRNEAHLDIGYMQRSTGEWKTVLSKTPEKDEEYRLIGAQVSPDDRYLALALCHSSNTDNKRLSTLYVYDFSGSEIIDTRIDSSDDEMEFCWSRDGRTLTAKQIVLSGGREKTLLYFCSSGCFESSHRIMEMDIYDDFDILWTEKERLFLKTASRLYVVRNLGERYDARLIFDKTALPFPVDSFSLSPSGERILLVREARGRNVKSDAWLCDLSGGNCTSLILPEGRRKYEKTFLYDYLKNCKLFVLDVWNALFVRNTA